MLVRSLVLALLSLLLGYLRVAPPPVPVPPAPDTSGADALKAAGDILRVSTGLATGALVFSVGLLSSVAAQASWVCLTLAVTWVALFFSVVTGVISQAAVPVLISEKRFDIEAPTFTWPGRIHQLLFTLAVFGLSVVLIGTLYADVGKLRIETADNAVRIARGALKVNEVPDRIEKIELIKGSDASRASQSSWHIQFHLGPGNPRASDTVDFILDARRGTISRIP